MQNRLTIIDQLKHPQLLGALPVFRDLKTWAMWLVFLKALFGLPLDSIELEAFQKFTGRERYLPPEGGFPEACVIAGVQCGKTTITGALLDSEVLTGQAGTVAVGVAQDHRGSMRVLLRYAREPFETIEIFKNEVERDTADFLELKRGTALGAYPCRPSALRGVKASIVVMDEAAHYIATDGRPTDLEMWRVARGRVAMTSGKIIAISSPYAQSGLLYDLHKKHFGKDESPVLVWQASSKDMNPCLSDDYLQRMQEDDPEAYRSEVLGEFRSGTSTLLDMEAIQACVDADVRERAPMSETTYVGFCDPSGGRHDRFVVAVAHADGERVVLDAVRVWTPPLNPSGVIAEACAFLKTYRVSQVHGDRYGAEYNAEQFRKNGLSYEPSERDRSEIYLELLPLINSERAVLLDHAELLRELRGLERRRGTSGKDKVDHRRGSTDDIANASAGALVLANKPLCVCGVFVL
ncbi:MAG: hypothetical protein OJF51_004866 [Nitrospira sp.]|jgi:hypothetical protein|nr:MAG: hypothetical protein OJF51_004866 [Nitrospira sp.]